MSRKNRYIFAGDRSRHLGRRFLTGFLIVLVLLTAVVAMTSYITTSRLTLETQRVTVANLPADLQNFAILHLSDLHGAELGERQSRVTRALGDTGYACVVMTGDMVGPSGDAGPLLELMACLRGDVPVLLIPGDEDPPYLSEMAHGSISPYAPWAETAVRAGAVILDRPYLITRGKKDQARLWFIPEEFYTMDDAAAERTWSGVLERLNGMTVLSADQAAQKRVAEYQLQRVADIRAARKAIQAGDVQIMVTHVPLTEEHASTLVSWSSREDVISIRQVSLVLCGHFCGGQWRLPGVGAVWAPELGWFPPDRLLRGYGLAAGVQQYISPGLGASELYPALHFRIFNTPTVTRVVLTSSR